VSARISLRRFDVLGGPGGYMSARYVGTMRPDEYVASWRILARVNVPRRLARTITPRSTYPAITRLYDWRTV